MSKQKDNHLEIMEHNNMIYTCDESLSCVVNKEMKQHRFVSSNIKNVKGGDQLILYFDALNDDEYINGANSFISLPITVDAPNIKNNLGQLVDGFFAWGNNRDFVGRIAADYEEYNSFLSTGGSVLNLFSTVELVSEKNEIIFSERFFNQNRTARQYEISSDRKETINAGMGGVCFNKKRNRYEFPYYRAWGNGVITEFGNEGISVFNIPLCEISDFFNTQKSIPACVLKNATLRLTFDNIDRTMFFYTRLISNNNSNLLPATNQDYWVGYSMDVFEPVLNYESVKVFDSINKIVKHNSIQIPYKTKFTVLTPKFENYLNFPISFTAAQIFNVRVKFIGTDYSLKNNNSNPEVYNVDQTSPMYALPYANMSGEVTGQANNIINVRVKFGDYYFPQFIPRYVGDYYNLTVSALNPLRGGVSCNDIIPSYNKPSVCSVSFQDYCYDVQSYYDNGEGAPANFSENGSIMAFDVQRSKDLGLSGLTTNPQRKLHVIFEHQNSNRDKSAYITVEYLQILEYKDGKITIMK